MRQRRVYARGSRSLMFAVICAWLALVFGVPVLVSQLLRTGWLEAGAGYIAVAIGVPVAMLVLVFWFCGRQEDLDRKAGVADQY